MSPRGEGRRLDPLSPRACQRSWLSCVGGGSQEKVLPLLSDDPGRNPTPEGLFHSLSSPLKPSPSHPPSLSTLGLCSHFKSKEIKPEMDPSPSPSPCLTPLSHVTPSASTCSCGLSLLPSGPWFLPGHCSRPLQGLDLDSFPLSPA